MRKTEKLKLNMPEPSDHINIEDLNNNALILDQSIVDIKDSSATKTELLAVSNDIENIKENGSSIKDLEQKIDKIDNTRAGIFFKTAGTSNLLKLTWLPEYGPLQNGTVIRMQVHTNLDNCIAINIYFTVDGTQKTAYIINDEGEKDIEGIKTGSIITVVYNKSKNSFIFQGKGGGYVKVDYKLESQNIIKGIEESLSKSRSNIRATTVGNIALFAGGGTVMDSYTLDRNSNLIKSVEVPLSKEKSGCAATTVGNIALFGGGNGSEKTVDSYRLDSNNSLIKGMATPLLEGKYSLAATTVGNIALFAGGKLIASTNIVDSYRLDNNNNLIKSVEAPLSISREALAATTVDDIALFGGGNGQGIKVDSYTLDSNNNLIKSEATDLLEANRAYLSATAVGNYALFGGGYECQLMDYYKKRF